MQKTLLSVALACLALSAQAQITITAADMPASGDTLRHSDAAAIGANLNLATTGANITWDYSFLIPTAQTVDQYKTAVQVSPLYAATIPVAAYGYKVADSIPGIGAVLPVSVTNIYTFFQKKTSPARYEAIGFGASLGPLPTGAVYSDPDEWYLFPLTYNHTDSTTYDLTVTVPGGLASLRQMGYRKTMVDGWGTIITPYFTTPKPVLRIRTETVEMDSITVQGMSLPAIPRHTVEYKWLANGEHYPALWITATVLGTTETPTTVAYRDSKRSLSIGGTSTPVQVLQVYPNPAESGLVTIKVPAAWASFTTEIFDMQGKLVMQGTKATIDLSGLAHGSYFIRVQHGNDLGLAKIIR